MTVETANQSSANMTINPPSQTFKNPKPNLLEKLKESGPVGGEENGVKSKRGDESAKKKKRPDKMVGCPPRKEQMRSRKDDGC